MIFPGITESKQPEADEKACSDKTAGSLFQLHGAGWIARLLTEEHHPKTFVLILRLSLGPLMCIAMQGLHFYTLLPENRKAWDFLLDSAEINAHDAQYLLNIMYGTQILLNIMHGTQTTIYCIYGHSIVYSRYLNVSKTAAGEHLSKH